ncbi:MAG TPA: hypothetical protein VEC12_15355 [Bacteroidia bacterium]|nr:hypothetical protein [Bacteroidia bacterium]
MKKLTLLVLFATLTSVFLDSCKSEDPEGPKPTPTVSWKTTAGYTFSNSDVQAGETIDFGVIAAPSDGENITRVRVSLSVNGGVETNFIDSPDLKLKNFNHDWMDVPVGSLPNAKNRFTVTVTQSNGESASATFIVTVTGSAANIQTTNDIELGAQNNPTVGSFFNPGQGSLGIMLAAQANSNQNDVHVIYYSGATNKETFSAPNDAQIGEVHKNVPGWTVKNATLFRKTTMSATDFDNLTDPNVIVTECNSASSSKVTNLKAGDVIAYRTFNGSHFALFKIESINAGGAGTITFDMKNTN